jgi:hypothetical protein
MPGSDARHFVASVHRRLIFFRTIEQLSLGLLIGSILAIALLAVAIWQSMPTGPILMFCGAFGCMVGCGLAACRWPTRMTAAIEADRQLRMDDLLTTAIFSSAITFDDFSQAVISMADTRCQSHSPSEVVLRQLGIRSWSGVGLAMATAAILAVIPFRPSSSQATDASISVLTSNPSADADANASQQSHGPLASTGNPMSETASSNAMTAEQPVGPNASSADHSQSNPGLGSTNGSGAGSSTTGAPSAQPPQSIGSDSHQQNQAGTTAGGWDRSSNNPELGESGGGPTNITGGSSKPTPQWNGNGQTNPRPSTPSTDDRIPPEDRDLVRQFFNRQ